MGRMTDADQKLPHAIEVYEVGTRRLYAKTSGRSFALFEDELTPEELIAIANDITARRQLAGSEEYDEGGRD
jgi:hypothetical protein